MKFIITIIDATGVYAKDTNLEPTTYKLSESSTFTGEQWVEYGITENGGRIPIGMNRVLRNFVIGQEITGHLLNNEIVCQK